jgi:hypothetical protein
MKFRQDYGNPFLDTICFDPYRKTIQFGTNIYYNQTYCKDPLAPDATTQIESYLFTTYQAPFFETYIYNQGITLKYNDPALKDYKAMLYYGGIPSIDFRLKSSENNYAYMQAAYDQITIGATYNGYNLDIAALNGQLSLRMETPNVDQVINLNLGDLISTNAKEVKLREFSICDKGISKKILLFASDFYV